MSDITKELQDIVKWGVKGYGTVIRERRRGVICPEDEIILDDTFFAGCILCQNHSNRILTEEEFEAMKQILRIGYLSLDRSIGKLKLNEIVPDEMETGVSLLYLRMAHGAFGWLQSYLPLFRAIVELDVARNTSKVLSDKELEEIEKQLKPNVCEELKIIYRSNFHGGLRYCIEIVELEQLCGSLQNELENMRRRRSNELFFKQKR